MEPSRDAVLTAITELAFDIVLVIGPDEAVTWRNRSDTRRPRGVADEAVVGLRLADRIHPDDMPDVFEGLASLANGTRSETFHRCRVFDEIDPTILHQVEVRGFDARHVPGVEGTLVLATIHDSRTPDRRGLGAVDFSIADVLPFGLAVVSVHDLVLYANERLFELVGLERGSDVSSSSMAELDRLLTDARASGAAQETVHGGSAILRFTARKLGWTDGHIVVSVEDITTETEAIEARLQSEETLRAGFEHTPAGIALIAPSGRMIDVNPAWLEITGFSREELIGESLEMITSLDQNDLRLIEGLIARTRESFRVEKLYRHRTGAQIWVDLWVSLVRDATGRPAHFVCQVIDITKEKRLEADVLEQQRDLTHRATHDHLTGLTNRAFFEESLRVAINRTARGTSNQALIFIDLDHFKPINDTRGHQAGDLALRETAARLLAECRGSDIVARLGGDEFGIIAEPTDMTDPGSRLAERLLVRIAEPLDSVEGRPSVSASIGITTLRVDDTIESATHRADQAVYAVKYSGGNGFSVADRDLPPESTTDASLT